MRYTVEWLSIPKAGETENGDHVVVRRDGARVLVAVIDALGHGAHAAEIARLAAARVTELPFPDNAMTVVDAVHERLRGTRGAAGLICLLSEGRLEACSVGNVEMRCHRSRVPILLSPGVLGTQLKRVRVFSGKLEQPDRIVVFSDGISARFSLNDTQDLAPAAACRAILERCRRAHDDATVLVADFGS